MTDDLIPEDDDVVVYSEWLNVEDDDTADSYDAQNTHHGQPGRGNSQAYGYTGPFGNLQRADRESPASAARNAAVARAAQLEGIKASILDAIRADVESARNTGEFAWSLERRRRFDGALNNRVWEDVRAAINGVRDTDPDTWKNFDIGTAVELTKNTATINLTLTSSRNDSRENLTFDVEFQIRKFGDQQRRIDPLSALSESPRPPMS